MMLIAAPDDYEDEDACKRAFAEGLLRWPNKPVAEVAASVFPVQLAAFVTRSEWERDESVIAHKRALLDAYGEEHFLPSKFDVAREVYRRATECRAAEDAFKGLKLYSEIMGFIDKADKSTNVTINQQNVMAYPVAENVDDWAERASKQQTKLIDVSAAKD